MALFTAEGMSYPDAKKLINRLKDVGIDASIATGGVAIHSTPDRINEVKSICTELGAMFKPGLSSHQENIFLRSADGLDRLEDINSNAIAVIKEWKDG